MPRRDPPPVMRCPDCSAVCWVAQCGDSFYWYCQDCEWESDLTRPDEHDEIQPVYDPPQTLEQIIGREPEKGKTP